MEANGEMAGSIAALGAHSSRRDNVNYECNGRKKQSLSSAPQHTDPRAVSTRYPLHRYYYYISTCFPLLFTSTTAAPTRSKLLIGECTSVKPLANQSNTVPAFIKSLKSIGT